MLNFESVNCDGKHIKWEFNTPNEVHRLFWSDTCPLPSNDDPIVHAELDGKPLPQCKAFLDLLHMLGLDEEQYLPEKGKTHKLIAIDLDNTRRLYDSVQGLHQPITEEIVQRSRTNRLRFRL